MIWSWFAAAESHNRLSQNQAQMIENPGLSYGLFHAVANPISSWGVVRKVTFPGVNMDIGHIRNLTWAKDNDAKKWIAYNRLRGQYMSALEHAVPERFFNDPRKCNLQGTTSPTAGLPDCPQGISAVKALWIAAAQGQRIYTITQQVYNDNPGIVNTALSAHSWDTQNRVQQSLDAGYEVTIHQSPITESGWTGAGYTAIDPATGAGAYTIDGGSNGAWLFLLMTFVFAILALATLAIFGPFAILGYGWMLFASFASAAKYLDMIGAEVNWPAVSNWIGLFLAIVGVTAFLPAAIIGKDFLIGAALKFVTGLGLITAIYSVLQ